MNKLHYLKVFTILLLIAIIGITSYLSFYKIPYAITVSKHVVVNGGLPAAFNGFKVGYLSDLVIQDSDDVLRLEKIVDKINQQSFDMILFGGDLYGNQMIETEKVTEILLKTTAKYGKFAVLGEKDYYDVDQAKTVLENSGFEVLSNASRTIYYNNSSIELLGLESADNIKNLVNQSNQGSYKLALVHQPDFFTYSKSNHIDLQLSGHSHGGYIYIPYLGPINSIEGAKEYNHGRYDEDESTLIVSNGLGMEDGQMVRFMTTPNILEVTLQNKE